MGSRRGEVQRPVQPDYGDSVLIIRNFVSILGPLKG